MIKRPTTDDREYRHFVLGNGLKAVVMSDSKADKAAAALTVGVGSFSDPPEIQGLAHFCEHMLFLGTRKYPDESSYKRFIESNGGSQNAGTCAEQTSYFFDVSPAALPEALDRFAQFFVDPLFTESATEREMKAVDSEHARNVQVDERRQFRVLSEAACSPAHPMHKFATGCLGTLGALPVSRVREALISFHSEFYSPFSMTLAVVGRQSLDELESLVRTSFSAIPNKSGRTAPTPIFPTASESKMPFSRAPIFINTVPVKDEKKLRLFWQTKEVFSLFRKKPGNFASHCLGHESEGSVLFALKARGWATALVAGTNRSWRSCSIFECSIDLTDEGFSHRNEVALLVFQYLSMLRRAGPQEWIVREIQEQWGVDFLFQPKVKALSHACRVADSMQRFPIEDIFSGWYLIEEYDPHEISSFLDSLAPENCVALTSAKSLEEKADQRERWHGAAFGVEPIPEATLKLWRDPPPCEPGINIGLPPKNIFMPTRAGVAIKAKEKEPLGQTHPSEVLRTPMSVCWHKQDKTFGVPKVIADFLILTPVTYSNARDVACAGLFVDLCDDRFNKWTYLAELAGLHYSLKTTWRGLCLKVVGYNEKLQAFVDQLLSEMRSLKVLPDRFQVMKEAYLRRQASWLKAQPTSHAALEMQNLVQIPHWAPKDKFEQAKTIQQSDVEGFISKLWGLGVRVLSFVHGNTTAPEACEVTRTVEKALSCPVLPLTHAPERRIVNLTPGIEETRHIQGVDAENANSAIFDWFQVCPRGNPASLESALLCLFDFVVREPCFTVLRTQEQLGYVVWSYEKRIGDICGMTFAIQSASHKPEHVESRITEFLLAFGDAIRSMPQEELAKFEEKLAEKLVERDTSLSMEAARHWPEIKKGTHCWNRAEELANVVKKITTSQLADFFERFISNPASRRKISLQIHGKGRPIAADGKVADMGNGTSFKSRFMAFAPTTTIFQ